MVARIVKKPEERKDELISIALKLFLLKGYASTSIKDIYSEVDGSFGMFYHHFRSKEEIFEAAMSKYVDSFMEKLSAVLLNEEFSFNDRYSMAISCYMEMLQGRDHISGFERGELDVSVFRVLSLRVLHESIAIIQTFLEEGVNKGIVHVEDAYQAAAFIVYGIYGIIREEGVRVSNLKNAPLLLVKMSSLINKVLGSNVAVLQDNNNKLHSDGI